MARTKQTPRMSGGNRRRRKRSPHNLRKERTSPPRKKFKIMAKMNQLERCYKEMNEFKAAITKKAHNLDVDLHKHQAIRNSLKKVIILSYASQISVKLTFFTEKRKETNCKN